jgi:hypothetical protein
LVKVVSAPSSWFDTATPSTVSLCETDNVRRGTGHPLPFLRNGAAGLELGALAGGKANPLAEAVARVLVAVAEMWTF